MSECGDDVVGFEYFACEKKLQSSLQVKCQEKWLEVVKRICSVGGC